MATVTDPLPLRLHRAVSILSRTGPLRLPGRLQGAGSSLPPPAACGRADAQSACTETAARIVMLEEALRALLSGKEGAAEQARRVLAIG